MSQVSDSTSYQSATQRMQDSFDAERAESRANQEKALKRTEQQAEETVNKTKQEYSQRLEEERAQAREEIRRLKEDAYDQSGKNFARDNKASQAEKNTLSRYRDEVSKDADRKVARAENRLASSGVHQKDLVDDKVSAALAAQKQSQYQEVKSLEDELDQYRNSDRDVEAEKAAGRAAGVTEVEGGNRDEKQRIIDGYERQIATMKRHEEEMARHYDRQLSESMFDSNENAQRQVKVQKQEFTKIFKDDVADKNRIEKTYKTDVDNLKARHERSSDNLIDQTMVEKERIVKDKDKTYQRYIAEKDARYSYDVGERDKKITELQTTDNELKVSPYVVKKINDAAEKKNYQSLTEAQAIHDKNLNAEKTRDTEDRRDLQQTFQTELANVHRDSRKELDIGTRQMRDSYQNLQDTHESQVASLTEQKRTQAERMYQANALALTNAQKDKMEALNEQRDSLDYQKLADLDDAHQLNRNQDREWFMKANDLRRNYEAKLSEERDQHQKVTQEMRLEYDKKLRDQDRVSKRDVDDRVRSYEHQITQQELAFKEKERFLTEHYEEELDKMKRTNAHLIQTKS